MAHAGSRAMARAQSTVRAGLSKVAKMPSPAVLTSRPRRSACAEGEPWFADRLQLLPGARRDSNSRFALTYSLMHSIVVAAAGSRQPADGW
jgi:hypothetical protein